MRGRAEGRCQVSAPFRLMQVCDGYWLNPYAVTNVSIDHTDGQTKIAFIGGGWATATGIDADSLARRINAFVSANELLERNGQMPTPEEERGAE